MTPENANEVLSAWETSSQYWNKHQALIEHMYSPLSRVLIEEAGIGPGHNVLDVGGGSGEPSLSIAAVVGELGSVVYTDPAEGMVKSASAAAARKGLTNISFQQSAAEKLPFAEATFDVAVGRFSSMFFSDAPVALREILRVVKPNGVVSFVVWAEREANPFFSVVAEVLDRFVPADPEVADAPEAFRFSAPGKLAKLLEQAGATAITERQFPFKIEATINVDQFWELRTEMSDTFRKKLARLVPDQVAAIRYTVQKRVGSYFKSGGMSFPGKVLLVSGKKRND